MCMSVHVGRSGIYAHAIVNGGTSIPT